jgi:hypothetical protein
MAKGPTKAQLALQEAKEWIEAAKVEIAEREADLERARLQLEMHETIYAVLEKTLTRAPKVKVGRVKKASRKGRSPRAQSLASAIAQAPKAVPASVETGPLCGICAHAADHEDHQQPSPHYHEFEGPKAAVAAGD